MPITPFRGLGFCDDAGFFRLDPTAADSFRAWRQQVKGQELEVVVQPRTSHRSLAQNRWLWGVAIPLIAEHCGNDAHELEDLHYDLLSVRFGTKAVAPTVPGAQPRIVPAKTSSELTVQEFSDYMDWLVRFAAEKLDVIIPLPDEPRDADAKGAA